MFNVSNNNLALIELITVNNYYLPLTKLFIILIVNDISLTCDKTIKSHLVVFMTAKKRIGNGLIQTQQTQLAR